MREDLPPVIIPPTSSYMYKNVEGTYVVFALFVPTFARYSVSAHFYAEDISERIWARTLIFSRPIRVKEY